MLLWIALYGFAPAVLLLRWEMSFTDMFIFKGGAGEHTYHARFQRFTAKRLRNGPEWWTRGLENQTLSQVSLLDGGAAAGPLALTRSCRQCRTDGQPVPEAAWWVPSGGALRVDGETGLCGSTGSGGWAPELERRHVRHQRLGPPSLIAGSCLRYTIQQRHSP